jgi:putative ATPase
MIPLAERLRPKSLEDYIGQLDLTGENGVIRLALQSGYLPSMIFWGPPGVGKTSLAQIIAQHIQRPFYTLSAISAGVKDVREIIDKASEKSLFSGGKTPVLFIDEIHRFSKSQQDSLLGAVEKGVITLIGATTENPSFEVNSALLSRCQVYTLQALSIAELKQLLENALQKDEVLKKRKVEIVEIEELTQLSGGDARRLLNNFELILNQFPQSTNFTNEMVRKVIKTNPLLFDKDGEQHYDLASALIKSIRGSHPDAAVYYLARLIEGGEDPKFIARRLLISASEDIGLANPTAMVMATNCFTAVEKIGYPECRIPLSQTVIYLATSPKSNSAYNAINKALAYVKKTGNLPVPLHLRNAPTQLMKNLDYGKNYKYPHDYEGNFVKQTYLPDSVTEQFYIPNNNPKETNIWQWLKKLWE